MSPATPKVWFITGCSAGFGISIARSVLAHGQRVIASSRNPGKTPELVEEITRRGGHWLTLDVTSPEADVKKVLDDAAAIYGHLDVVVNNAGYGVFGAIEDVTLSAAHAQFETNVFGVLKVTKAVLPRLRAARSGTIVNISSIGGLVARPGAGLYSASKHALEAISESLSGEMAPFGVRVLLVEPGMFRTNFLGPGATAWQVPSEPYRGTPVEETVNQFQGADGKQPGDPEKAAERIYEVVTGEGMAKGRKEHLRLLLGSVAFDRAQAKFSQAREDLSAWEDISRSTEYD